MIEKKPDTIRRQSKRNEDVNWRFRAFLKMQDGGKTDRKVKPIFEQVAKQIDCLECGNCCKEMQPSILNRDIIKLRKTLGLSREDVIDRFIEFDEYNTMVLKGKPCVFLKGNECQIYKNRPSDCVSFPHLHKNGFTGRLIGVIQNMEICPIVYNVVEALKTEFNFR